MSHTVEYFRIADKKPANGQEIWFIERPSGFYGTMDMKYGVSAY